MRQCISFFFYFGIPCWEKNKKIWVSRTRCLFRWWFSAPFTWNHFLLTILVKMNSKVFNLLLTLFSVIVDNGGVVVYCWIFYVDSKIFNANKYRMFVASLFFSSFTFPLLLYENSDFSLCMSSFSKVLAFYLCLNCIPFFHITTNSRLWLRFIIFHGFQFSSLFRKFFRASNASAVCNTMYPFVYFWQRIYLKFWTWEKVVECVLKSKGNIPLK